MTTSPLRNLNVLTVPILFMASQNVFSVSRNQTKSTQEFQTIPYFFTPNMVIFQTPYHFIKRRQNLNAHYNSHSFHRFWYRSFCYWSAIPSQMLAIPYVSSSSFSGRSHPFAKCLPNQSKYLFFRHVQKVIFEEHEIRTLQSLLKEYMTIMEIYNHSAHGVKSSFLRTWQIRE